jgi:hypothetical protein
MGNNNKTRQIPVVLEASAIKNIYTTQEPLLINLTIRNGLKDSIRFSSFSLVPNELNSETFNCSIVDIYRNDNKQLLFLYRPKFEWPKNIAGPSSIVIKPNTSLTIQLDCRKWSIKDGWIPGAYTISTRVDYIQADSYTTINILSDFIKFTIK